MACTVQMPGWFKDDAARASRSNRSSIGASLRELRREKLHGDASPEARVLGLVHDTHAAGAELAHDPVVRNRRSEQRLLLEIRAAGLDAQLP